MTYRQSPTSDGSTLGWCESNIHSVESMLQTLEFGSFPRLAVFGRKFLRILVRAAATAPSQPRDHQGKQPICLQTTLNPVILFFTFSTVFKNDMR